MIENLDVLRENCQNTYNENSMKATLHKPRHIKKLRIEYTLTIYPVSTVTLHLRSKKGGLQVITKTSLVPSETISMSFWEVLYTSGFPFDF